MVCCLNPACQQPQNPDGAKFCLTCGTKLVPLLAGHYRIIRLVGGGGFARTYLAEDIQKLNELCVIKQLAPSIQSSRALQKATDLFEQEAQRLQQLGSHPQIPTLYAYFEQDRCLYLAQEYIEGQDLSEELEQLGEWSEPKIWELLTDLLQVLQFIHEQQVIHRDIKPENVIRRQSKYPSLGRTKTFDHPQLVLIDFGVAKPLRATPVAKPGTTIGSLGYAPIEQLKGGEAYRASDLYSLGVTCFELLTQVHPWELWTEQGYNWVSRWQQHLKHPVSQELVQILDKLLQKDVMLRYQSAAEVLRDLDASWSRQYYKQTPLSSNPPLSSLPYSPQYQTTRTNLYLPQSSLQKSQIRMNYYSGQVGGTLRSGGGNSQTSRFSHWLYLRLSRQNIWLLVGIILLLGLGGYRSLQVQGQLSAKTPMHEKQALINTLTGHSDIVRSIAISPDGQTIVSGSNDQTIKIWQLSSGILRRTLSGHTSWISTVAISPDGQTVVSGSGDTTIKVWQLSTGKLLRTLTGHSRSVYAVAISPDGQTLVSGSSDNTIKIWQLSSGQLLRTLTKHSYGVHSMTISPDAQTLVSGNGEIWPYGEDYTIKVWGLKTGAAKRTLNGHSNNVISVAISPDSQTLISGSEDKSIQMWQLSTGQLLHTLAGHSGAVYTLAISPDGQTLVSGSGDRTIKVWQMNTGTPRKTLTGHSSAVYALAISPDGQTLISGSDDKTIKIWRLP
ncbi:MAG TPA: WD40 repeat domain-containing serine/threonine-protein kinase [Coleofasciculaceae cyanobacterium]